MCSGAISRAKPQPLEAEMAVETPAAADTAMAVRKSSFYREAVFRD
jgi:hypothetical protein